jgi:hypothetical protein
MIIVNEGITKINAFRLNGISTHFLNEFAKPF